MTKLRKAIEAARNRLRRVRREVGNRISALRRRIEEIQRLRRIYRILGAHGKLIYEEAKRAGLELALARALVEQESGNRNIFGCDWGPQGDRPPYCHQAVTRARVQALLRAGKANGVGLTQLTSFGYVQAAERLGGAHLPRNQLRVGFQVLAGFIRRHGLRTGIGAYNGGEGNPQFGYADEVLAKRAVWKQRLS